MRWIEDRSPRTDVVSRSADGYYRVSVHYGGAEFVAWFLEADKPLELATRANLEDAQEFCEEHARTPRAL